MKKRYIFTLTVILGSFVIFFVLTYCSNSSIKKDYEKGIEIPPELLKIEVTYTKFAFPSPVEPMSYTIQINSEGLLTKEYKDAERYEDKYDLSKQLSHDELVELIDVIITNNFFRISKNVDGKTNITDQDSRYLAIAYDGKARECNGYNTDNKKYLMICDYIEKLASK